MSRQRHTRVTPVNNTPAPDSFEPGESFAASFADSKIPDMEPRAGQDFVPFGPENNYPGYLLELYNKSAKHNAIINGKCIYILGSGFTSTDEPMQQYLKKANEKQSWDDLAQMICPDLENFGGCYLEVIPRKGGGFNVYHIAYNRMRTNENNTKYYYRRKWSRGWETAEKIYNAFSPDAEVATIFFIKEYRSTKGAYPLPSFLAACNWIESDIEVSKAMLTSAKTGFSPSKFINFYNGEPSEAKKAANEKRLSNAFTGSEGKRLLIAYNNDPAKRPTVDDLGSSDLTKEDFSRADNVITSNIFAGHSVTHPLLFGIQQEGKLGNSSELKAAFDIFKNTYANAKQRNLEKVVKYFAKLHNINGEVTIVDIKPVGVEFSETTIVQFAPKEWIMEQLGIDLSKYPAAATAPAAGVAQAAMANNSTLTNLTGKQHQQISRIVRQYGQGKLSATQAGLLLKNGFGFTDADVSEYLGFEQDFADESEETIAAMFAEYGTARADYMVQKSEVFTSDADELQFAFAAFAEVSEHEKKIVDILKDNPKATPKTIGEKLGLSPESVAAIIDNAGGVKKMTEAVKKVTLPDIQVMYSYEKRPEVAGATILPTSRAFCKKMVALSETKLFSREDIQAISNRLGYSVMKRAGGFWNNGTSIEYQCRHGWFRHVVIKKNKN